MLAMFERHPVAHSLRNNDVDLPERQVPIAIPPGNIKNIRSIPRSYLIIHLRQHGHRAVADRLVNERGLNLKIHNSMERIHERLENDISDQFTDLGTLFCSTNNQDLKVEFDSVAENIFSDAVNWGCVLTFLRFSSQFAVRCILNADVHISAADVLDWTEAEVVARFPQLVEANPEIAQLLDTETDWHVDMSAVALTTGLAVTLVTAGLFALKRIL